MQEHVDAESAAECHRFLAVERHARDLAEDGALKMSTFNQMFPYFKKMFAEFQQIFQNSCEYGDLGIKIIRLPEVLRLFHE